jgi:hypothetical protein
MPGYWAYEASFVCIRVIMSPRSQAVWVFFKKNKKLSTIIIIFGKIVQQKKYLKN